MRTRFLDRALAGESLTAVLYGTSLTEGPWSAMLEAWFARRCPGVRIANCCQPGKASRTGLRLLEPCVLVQKPDLVTLEFAVNDATRVYTPDNDDFEISLDESRRNLSTLIDRIQARSPDCEIVIQTMNPGWDAPNGRRSASLRPQLAAYYEGYRQVAAERGLFLADHFAAWGRLRTSDEALFRLCVPDGIHPVALGSERVTFPGVMKTLGAAD